MAMVMLDVSGNSNGTGNDTDIVPRVAGCRSLS